MANIEVHFSSKTIYWETPQNTFDKLNEEFNFTLDVCANDDNKKCDKFFSEEYDGLSQDWSNDICWMNPPYGREIGKWVKKAHEESLKGATVVALLPSRIDTRWFHDYCIDKEVRFLKGRLKFGGSKNSAPFPSIVVVFKPLKGETND